MPEPESKKSGWDDKDEDWGRKPGSVQPGEFPPTPPPRGPTIVTWMYIVVGMLVLAQIAYYFLKD